MTPRRILAYGLLAAIAAAALAVVTPSFLSILDLRVLDAMLRVSATRPPSDRVAIVAVDDQSLSDLGQWPWPRDVLAQLVDRVRGLGASVVAVDMLLAEPDRLDQARPPTAAGGDSALAAALGPGRVVMSYALTFEATRRVDGSCVLHPIGVALVQGAGQPSPVERLFHASGVVCSLPAFNRAAGASGYLNAGADSDGLLRRIPLLMEFRGEIYPSLALAAFWHGTGARQLTLARLAGGGTELSGNGWRVPLDERGTMLVRFRGGHGTYPHIPASDVLKGRIAGGALKGRVVFIGATALGVRDVVATPLDRALSGVEVHAAAVDTLLQADAVSIPWYARAATLSATVLGGLIAAALVAAAGGLYGSVLAVLGLGVLWWAALAGLGSQGMFLSPLAPTIAIVLVLSTLAVARAREEHRLAGAEREGRERAQQFAVQSLTSLMEARDADTGRHARRTQEYSRTLASRLSSLPRFRDYLTPEHVELISWLSPLHDIGKVAISDAVLNKPGPLSQDELAEMRRHPGFGHEAITRAQRLSGPGVSVRGEEALIRVALDVVYTHHERWDGEGYPRGLRAEQIPIAGRIVALVDVYDALCSARPYRSGFTHEQAVSTIQGWRGTHFDPDVVDAFLAVQETFRELSSKAKDAGAVGAGA